jgi:hypothetical protein
MYWNTPYSRYNRNSQEQRKKLPTIILVDVVVQGSSQRADMLPSDSHEISISLLAELEAPKNRIYAPLLCITV